MQKHLFLILGFGLFTVSFLAQTPPTPVAKATVKASHSILESDGFSVKFPSRPSRTVTKINTAFGMQDYVAYSLSNSFAFYSASYVDFPTVIKDEEEKRIRLELVRNALLKEPGSRMTSETEIYFGDHFGMDFVMERGETTIKARVVFVEQRFFQLMVITKGKAAKITPKLRAFYQTLTSDFIDSFKVTTLPTPTAQIVQLPADFGITVTDSIVRSSFFGMSVRVPDGWTVADSVQTSMVKELGASTTGNVPQKMQKQLDFSLKNTEVLLVASKTGLDATEGSATFMVAAEQVSFPNFLPEKYVEGYLKNFVESTERITVPNGRTTKGGAEFAWVETEDTVTKVRQRMYMANRKGICFEVLFTYRDQAELAAMLKALDSLKFDEK